MDLELLLMAIFLSALGLILAFIIRLLLFPSSKQMKAALEKADYMIECVSRLSPAQREAIENEIENVLGKVWRSKTYLTTQVPVYPEFGEHCLYGKVAARKTFALNQHIILPYQNIVEIVVNERESGASKVIRTTINTLSAASAILAVVSGSGGAFTFVEKRPTVIVIDNAGNTFQIDCKDSDAFLEKLSEKFVTHE